MSFRITKITAFVAIDEVGDVEGVLGTRVGNTWFPLICADEEQIRKMYPVAKSICKDFRIAEFSVRKDVTEQVKLKYDS
jgi:hypothetical protein